MRTALALLGALLTAGAATVSVQHPPPDLTGTWVATKDTPPTMAAAPSAVFGERFGLRQEGKNIALIRPVRGRTAATCGYADQAHFIRDFRNLAGCAPGEHLLKQGELTGVFTGQG